jgi:hypothetical protein
MKHLRKLATIAVGFWMLSGPLYAKRTCRVVYPERPKNAPKIAYFFDGTSSQLVTLPSMNFSKVIEFPDGNLTIAMTAKQIADPTALPANTPMLQIPERVRDFYIIINPDPDNKQFPVKMNLIETGGAKFKPGQTLWFNFTEHKIVAKLGNAKLTVEPKGKTISNGPLPKSGYYTANIGYQPQGKGPIAPVTQQQWWHDANSRHLGFIVGTGGRLPRLYYYRDFRISEAAKQQIAEADPKDLEPVYEEPEKSPEPGTSE